MSTLPELIKQFEGELVKKPKGLNEYTLMLNGHNGINLLSAIRDEYTIAGWKAECYNGAFGMTFLKLIR